MENIEPPIRSDMALGEMVYTQVCGFLVGFLTPRCAKFEKISAKDSRVFCIR